MPAAVSTPPGHHHGNGSSPCASRNTYTHLTYSRHHLQGIAVETIKIAENGQYVNCHGQTVHLKEDLDYAVDNSVHYEDGFDFHAALELHDMEKSCRLNSSLQRQGSCGSAALGSLDEHEGGVSTSGSESSGSDANASSSPRKGGHSSLVSRSGNCGTLRSANALDLSFVGPSSPGGPRRFPRTSFLVVSASWLEAASELLQASSIVDGGGAGGVRVGVLNSASGTTPGGRFLKGTVSQEDCLCRASLLYSCISQPRFQSDCRFYGKNRSLRYGSSSCVIFSPDVPVIREDNVEGKLLDSYEKVSFVSIPAPNAFTTSTNTGKEYNDDGNCRKSNSHVNLASRVESSCDLSSLGTGADDIDERLEAKRRALLDSLSDRIHRALAAFVLGGCTDVVLPSFGCGVHGNDPAMVASVFREMLTDPKLFGGRFRTVVFAIPPSRKQNYQAFAAYFQKKERVGKRSTMLN